MITTQEIACNPNFLKVEAYPNVAKVADQDNQALWSNAVIEIHRLHTEILSHARISLDKAILIGEILAQVKDTLKHGAFNPFIEQHLPFSRRTAFNYLFVYENRTALKSANVALLGDAYSIMLAKPNGDKDETAKLHDPNFFSKFHKVEQNGMVLYAHYIQRRPLSQWETELLFDTLSSVEPWVAVRNAIREELAKRPDAPSSY